MLFLKLQANKKPDVLTIIDDLDDDDDDNDDLDVDNDPKNKTPDVFTIINDLDADDDDDDDDFADNDPKNWKYFLNDFSGLECSNNLTKKVIASLKSCTFFVNSWNVKCSNEKSINYQFIKISSVLIADDFLLAGCTLFAFKF